MLVFVLGSRLWLRLGLGCDNMPRKKFLRGNVKKNSIFVDIVHVGRGRGEVNPMSKIEIKRFFDKS